ncbi:hypothetical protein [Streptomyces sp. RTd22]|uniref:hypothetical protein n=1 Tax=Streptomyces sp. RTd22 TaxID=1841249 RepID=UPI000AC9F554|nr:hypothetical protein [Streptomyces sp. RTd22]
MYHDDSWGPLPPRSATPLVFRFVLSVLILPLWWLLLAVLFLVFLAFALVADIFTLIPGFEKGFGKVMDRFHAAVALWPAWSVTWPELRHEGDADYYRARADGKVAGLTTAQLTAREAGKAPPPGPYDIPVRDYRAVGAGHVLEVARGHGWDLSHDLPSDPARIVRLRRLPEAP